MTLEEGWSALRGRDVAVVHLIRRDLLSVICSRERALKSNNWFTKSEHDLRRSLDPIELDVDKVKKEIKETLEFIHSARQWFQTGRYIEVSYEDLVEDSGTQLDRIQSFLGVCSTSLESRLVKQRVKPIFEDIQNFNEVIEAIEEFKTHPDFTAPEIL